MNEGRGLMVASTELRVKEMLRQRKWTTKMLAEKTGMSESYLTHIKNGTRRWNEDILKRLAEAFSVEPIDLLRRAGEVSEPAPVVIVEPVRGARLAQELMTIDAPMVIPVVGEIVSEPSLEANRAMQIATGHKNAFVPVLGLKDDLAFSVRIDSHNFKPHFFRGDDVIVSPRAEIKSGDIVAIEYSKPDKVKTFVQISYAEEFIILESLTQKKTPVALLKGKDQYRIIGKVVYRYQKLD